MAGKSFAFALTFVALFALTYVFLGAVDALPNPITSEDTSDGTSPLPQPISNDNIQTEEPTRIVAKNINLDVTVANPSSTDIEALDAALLKGAVRYPTSQLLGPDGTVLIFGHSSYLPIVHNQNYKAFDGIQDLKTGQVISVYSGTTEYRYAVTGVKMADAKQDVIELPATGKHLTLVTCDSFGTKSDRFIVTADFVGAYSLN